MDSRPTRMTYRSWSPWGAHRFTGVRLEHLDDLLSGLSAPKTTFQFNLGDPYIGKHIVKLAAIPPWQWPANSSGLLWIENEPPFRLIARPNQRARRQLPVELSGSSAS